MPAARNIPPANSGQLARWFCGLLAIGIHLAVLCAWRANPAQPALITNDGNSIEVALVESAAGPDAATAEPSNQSPEQEAPAQEKPADATVEQVIPTPTDPPPEQPSPIPAPTANPEPNSDQPPPHPESKPPEQLPPEQLPPEPSKSAPTKPKSTAKSANSQSSKSAHSDTPSKGGGTGTGNAFGKPAYLISPNPSYPAESRASGEQGVVMLQITVDGGGRPNSVSLARSSGYPRLDRSAIEAAWRCRLTNASSGTAFEIPIRFNLRN